MKRKKHSLYWQCQLVGWTAASLYWSFSGMLSGGFNFSLALVHLVSDVILYIGITHLYRLFVLRNQWQQLALKPLLKRLFPAIIVLAAAYTVVTLTKIYLIRFYLVPGFSQDVYDFINANTLGVAMAGVRLMSIWMLAYHGYHYALREMRLIQENGQLQLALKDAQLQNLSAQLNPHFLFNALNTIKSMVIGQPASARRGIDLLSEILRTSLYEDEHQETTIHAELALTLDYLELEQLRMEDRLQYEVVMDDGLRELSIPRLSLITMVENAVKHGIALNKQGGHLIISGILQENGYGITVSHPGKLGAGNGIGLKNLKERLEILYKNKAVFSISEQQGIVTASLFIPL
ncbi:sensor histidine kinase [Sediminibacterium ginsengisoli]|nr:histidine kinase [Sediminibacterium ginsengisoli]